MSIESSLSLHNDITWNLEHDERTSEVLPNNVNPEDSHENIYWEGNTTVKAVYDECFEEAFQKHQKKLKVADRFDGTYLEKICADAAKKEKYANELKKQNAPYTEQRKANRYTKVAYQIVVTIGNCHDNPEFKHGGEKEDVAKAILSQYMNSFQERNPGFRMVCGAIHCDEGDRFDADGNLTKVGGNIHLHLTYVPVAECKIGQKVQNSLSGALRMMGLESDKQKDPITGRYMTAQTKWQYRERDYLSELCKQYDIEIVSAGKGDERHLTVDDYQRKQEIDYVNQSKKDISEREKQVEIREQTIQDILDANPTAAEVEEIINENVELFQRNDELERRDDGNQKFIKDIREDYFRESSALWEVRKREKEELKKLIKDASENKRFDEAKYKKLMNSVYNTNENIIIRLFKFIYSLFFRYKIKKEEQELQALVEENKKMKEKSKEIVDAGKNLTAALKRKNTNEILEALDKWDYAIGKIEDSLFHKIDLDMANEELKKQAYQERLARREQQEGEERNNQHFDFDDLR